MAKSLQLTALLLLALLFSVPGLAQHRNGAIQGKVLTKDGRPASGVSSQVVKPSLGAVSDDNGNFGIPGIRPGSYSIKASAINVTAQEQPVSVSAGQTAQVEFKLEISASDLGEVI